MKQGQLLAELENRDLVAAEVASKGQFGQAESNYRSTTAMAVPEAATKAQTDADSARQSLDAAQKLLESRQQLLKEGALARKSVDEAQVAYAQAKAQFETAQQHLQALQAVGKQEQINTAAAQVEAAQGQYQSAQAQVAYSQIRSPINGVVTDRPLYAGEMAAAGAPLLTVMDMSAVIARISMAQDQAKDVKVGDEATLTPADGGDPVPGKVTDRQPGGRSEYHDGAGVGAGEQSRREAARRARRCTWRSSPRRSTARCSCRPRRSCRATKAARSS